MENAPPRRVFLLKGLLAVVIISGLLLTMLVPSIQAAREAARRNQCNCQLKQFGLALQNYHDVFKQFPALTSQGDRGGSTNVWDTAPGATFAPDSAPPNGYAQSPASASGYSWIVMILPYMEEHDLYNDVAAASDGFTYEAFSATGVGGKPFAPAGNPAGHFATVQLDGFRCPSFAGSGISTASSGKAQPPVTIAPYAKLYSASARSATGVAVSNYFALSATHLACMALGPSDTPTGSAEPPNGVIVPGNGISMKEVLDGTSKTLIVCETKEPAVNSWYDGTVCWTVGANPSASNQPTRNTSAIATDDVKNVKGYWVVPQGTTNAGSLNYGPGRSGKPLFAPGGTTPAQTQPVSWGPSSDHAGGVVMHLACDASAHAITADIDPTLYIQLISRAGGEHVVLPDVFGGTERPRPVLANGEMESKKAAVTLH